MAGVTLKDIAKEAKVTVMTVSNVINARPGQVSEKTAARVRAIAESMGYVPSAAARSLAARSSNLIGCLLRHSYGDNALLDWHNAAITGYIEPALRAHGYHMLLQGFTDAAEIPAAIQTWNLDGAIFVSFTDEDFEAMGTMPSKPFVAVENYSQRPGIMTTHSDDREGTRMATEHLIDKGHRRIAYVGSTQSSYRIFTERYAGYCAALNEAGIDIEPSLTIDSGPHIALDTAFPLGVDIGKSLLNRCPGATAVVVMADVLAAGIMSGLASVGQSVPEDVSVIGFDNRDVCTLVSPPLTTVNQDIKAKAVAAVDMLLTRIKGGPVTSRETVIPVKLIERSSVRDLTAGSLGPVSE